MPPKKRRVHQVAIYPLTLNGYLKSLPLRWPRQVLHDPLLTPRIPLPRPTLRRQLPFMHRHNLLDANSPLRNRIIHVPTRARPRKVPLVFVLGVNVFDGDYVLHFTISRFAGVGDSGERLEGEGLGVCCSAWLAVGCRAAVGFVGAGEEAGEEDAQDGFDAGEAAAYHAEIHFAGHCGIYGGCVP